MGVDITIYRARIGSFGPRLGKGDVGSIAISTTALMIIVIGAVIFIQRLLVMAGIESNPGPPTGYEFTFRYQYLLIEIGTKVLRQLFDHLVNHDFCQFLNINTAANKQLQYLFLKTVIKADQQKVLPPIDTKPSSTNFDVTLVCCLLRNVCGLKPHNDNSWIQPAASDISVEANICRLRELRNELVHSGSVFDSSVDLKAKWKNLSQILQDINTVCKMQNLTALINNAEKMDIDENLKKQYDLILRIWANADEFESLIQLLEGQAQLKEGQTQLKEGQTQIKDGQTHLKEGQTQIKEGQTQIKEGQTQIKEGQTQLKDGQTQIKDGQTHLKEGQMQIKEGQTQIKEGQTKIKEGQTQLKDGQSKLQDGQTQLKDGQTQLKDRQTKLKKGQTQIKDGQIQLKDGQIQLKHGQTELKEGQTHLKEGHTQLKEGQTKIKAVIKDCHNQLAKCQTQLIQGQSNLDLGQAHIQSLIKQEIFELKQDIPVMKTGLETMEKSVQELDNNQKRTHQQIENIEKTLVNCKGQKVDINESDIRDRLVTIYKEDCWTLPVLPLCEEDQDHKDLLSAYKPPSLCHKPYHKSQEEVHEYEISSYRDIFQKGDKCFRKVYITGDAGTGKTSLCKRMTLLWCKAKSGETVGEKAVQDDIDFMATFDFVFYVSLSNARRTDIVTIITDQLFCNANEDKKSTIENILERYKCLVIMDALDEFNESGQININRVLSEKCLFMTTCRPYKIESDRLAPKFIDRQVHMKGIRFDSIETFVTEIVNHMNEATGDNKNPQDFINDVRRCGLYDQLHIPIIGSHLVVVWFNHGLTDMTPSLIYSNIVDMLLQRAETGKHIELPVSVEGDKQLPDSLSELFYLNKYTTFLKKICLLSFNLLFMQDKALSEAVFTPEQLESKPYFVSVKEMNFLCKFGILSKSKVVGRYGRREQKLAFLHKTYLEYFASLYVASFDCDDAFCDVVKPWNSLDYMKQYETFFKFYVGFSCKKRIPICGDLSSSRMNYIFNNPSRHELQMQTYFLKNLIKKQFSNKSSIKCLKLEDFVFEPDNMEFLKNHLLLNCSCVKFLHSVLGTYFDVFDKITHLQYLYVGNSLNYYSPYEYGLNEPLTYDEKFNELMLRNAASLHTVRIENRFCSSIPKHFSAINPLTGELPLKHLPLLTSLSLSYVKMQHDILQNILAIISDNVLFENIELYYIECDSHKRKYENCSLELKLAHHSKLEILFLKNVNIVCSEVNTSSLKSITLHPKSEKAARSYIGTICCLKALSLEIIDICGRFDSLNSEVMKCLTAAVEMSPQLKALELISMTIPNDVCLQIHPDVRDVEIIIDSVTMSHACFQSFIDSCVHHPSGNEVYFTNCHITVNEGESYRTLSQTDSYDSMCKYLKSKPLYYTTRPSRHSISVKGMTGV